MKRIALAAILIAASAAYSGERSYQKGVLQQMDSEACGVAENGGKTVAGAILGTDGQHKNTRQVLCQEYVLETDRIIYRIRPKDDKHPVLLPVGETAEFRIHKDTLHLRVPELDGKEREYIVVSMTQRTGTPSAKSESPKPQR
jgi:hypothetical protein